MKTLFAITHVNKDGMRTLTFANQGRNHYETADKAFAAMRELNRTCARRFSATRRTLFRFARSPATTTATRWVSGLVETNKEGDMGLDISAYRQLKPLRDYDDSGEYDYPREIPIWVNTDFPGRCDEFVGPRKLYGFEERFDFRAGSYSGYNAWRNELAKLAGANRWPTRKRSTRTPTAYSATRMRACHLSNSSTSPTTRAPSEPP